MSPQPRSISPAQLLHDLGIDSPDEIDVEAIAQYCGARIDYEPLTGCAARIIGYRDRAIITIDRASSSPRRRFSGGHELGHWMHDRGKALACTDTQLSEWFTENPERRANRYAADLLMPVFMFKPRTDNRPVIFSTVDDLATTFQTSITSTAIRLVEHGAYPSMVICSDAIERKWFTRSEIVPDTLWPHESPGRQTMAFALHQNRSASPPGPTEVNAAQWITHPKASHYTVKEDSIRTTAGLVLTLLWWQDERQLLDLDDEQEEEDSEQDKNPYDFD